MSEPAGQATEAGFAYFMVRVRMNATGEPASIVGVAERLGTGRKHHFQNGPALLQLLAEWSQMHAKMQSAESGSNAASPPAES